MGSGTLQVNYKADDVVCGTAPRGARKAKEATIESFRADYLGLKPTKFDLSTHTTSNRKFTGSAAVLCLSNSGVREEVDSSTPPANTISSWGVRTITFTKDELPGDWNCAMKIDRKALENAHNSFLKRNLANTKRVSRSMTKYTPPSEAQSVANEEMREGKRKLRKAGVDATDVGTYLQTLTRMGKTEKAASMTQSQGYQPSQRYRSMRGPSKEDLDALRELDTWKPTTNSK